METKLNDLRENVSATLDLADEYLKKAAEATGEEAKEFQEKAKCCLARARGNLKDTFEAVSADGREAIDHINTCVHEHPWRAVGVFATVGLVLGILISRK